MIHSTRLSARIAPALAISLMLLPPAFLQGCASTKSERPRSASKDPDAAPPFDEETRARFETWWKLYTDDDPGWPAARDQWMARPDRERNVLIESLLRDVIVATNRSEVQRYDRARTELVRIGAPAVPYLIRLGQAGDDVLRAQMMEILSLIGPPALEPVMAALASAKKDDPFRRQYVEVLGEIGDPRAFDLLQRVLNEDPDWKMRAAAALAVGAVGDPGSAGALAAAAKSESDGYVLERIAEGLGKVPEAEAADALVSLMERESRRKEIRLRVIYACTRSLRSLTGQRIGNDPAAWREWWSRNRTHASTVLHAPK